MPLPADFPALNVLGALLVVIVMVVEWSLNATSMTHYYGLASRREF